jgi:hypothetical protein
MRLRILVVCGLVCVAGAWLTACATVTAKNPEAVVAAHADDFNTGTPEAKNIWDAVVAQVNSEDYAAALTTLEQLQGESGLTPQQIRAIQETVAATKKALDSGRTAAPAQ